MMSELLCEHVFPMPPMSTGLIEALGDETLDYFSSSWRDAPAPLDLVHIVDHALPKVGIHVSPASAAELQDRYAATDPGGKDDIDILVREDIFDDLVQGGRRAHLPRVTIAHEIAHALLHVPELRRRLRAPQHAQLLARQRRDELKPYEDPEWQAFAFAGAILIPRRSLLTLRCITISEIVRVFEVSEKFAQSHLKRLRIAAQ